MLSTSPSHQRGVSTWLILPWLIVVALAVVLYWYVQNNPMQENSPKVNTLTATSIGALEEDKNTTTYPKTTTPMVSSYHDAVSRAAPSVVNIYTTQTVRNPYANDPIFSQLFEQQRNANSLGSGVIVSEDGYIITNAHVIEQADEITVAVNDGRKSRAVVIGQDAESDLAVIKVDLDNLNPISFRHDPIQVGDVTLAIGNPFGVGQTVTQGIISATGRAGLGVSVFQDFIQTDAAINPGNSGGALVDSDGQLIGINTMIYSRSGGSNGIGFAIPTAIVEQVMTGLIKSGKVSRGWLGVELTAAIDNPTDLNTTNGVKIMGILPDSPAQKAGLQANDIILSLDGTPVTNTPSAIAIISKKTPDSTLAIVVNRDGQEHNINVTIAERPSISRTQSNPQNPQQRQLTPEEAMRLQELFEQLRR